MKKTLFTKLLKSSKRIIFPLTILMSLHYVTTAQETNSEFKPSGKVWGYLFGDYYYKMSGDTAVGFKDTIPWGSKAEFSGREKDYNAFTIRRVYLGYDYQISPKLSTSFVLEGNEGSNSIGGKRGVYIKNAFLEWRKIYRNTSLLIGQSATPTWSLSEKIWSYRAVEKTLMDARGMGRSNDLGVALKGSIDSAGIFNYWLMAGNGTAESPETNKIKNFYADVNVALMDKKLLLEANYEWEDYGISGPLNISKSTIKGFVAYDSKPITIGIEGFYQIQRAVKADTTDKTPMGLSIFIKGVLIKDKLNAFARFDMMNPDSKYRDKDTLSKFSYSKMFENYEEQFITFGLDFTPHKNVHIIPNIWMNAFKPKVETTIQKTRTADLVARITFYYIFK